MTGCCTLFTAFAVITAAAAQRPVDQTLPPPRPDLFAVHWPDLTNLEPDVRNQLTVIQRTLTSALKDTSATEGTLAEAYGETGNVYHAYSLIVPARECYLNANRLAPKDFRWLYLLAKINQREGRAEDAIRHYQEARALNPEYVPIEVSLGSLYLELNLPEMAEASFEKARAREPTNAAALYGLGQWALSQHRYAEAVSYFEGALKQVPGANRIHYSLAIAYRGLGDLAQAESHLAQRGTVGLRIVDPLIDQLPELVAGERVHLVRGRMALEAKRFQDAAVEFRKAIAAKPASVTAHLNLATVLMQMNDSSGAIAEFLTVLRLDPVNAIARFNLAIELANQNKHAEAIEQLQVLLSADPKDAGARTFLAHELLKLERRDEALTEFLRVSESDPDNEVALLEVVNFLLQETQYKEALDRVEKGYARYPQKAQTAATLAYLLAASPRYDLRAGERALELAQRLYQTTGLPEHGAIVALALAELGRCAAAADWQRRMISSAEQQRQPDLATKLKADLKLYETAGPCRPAGEK